MRVVFARRARSDAQRALAFYERVSPRLADQFGGRLDEAIARILADPQAWPPYLRGTRRCLLTQFPHAVVYRPLPDRVEVVAVVHTSRRPGYW